MNNSVITGNLGDDPKSFYTPDGAQIVTFDLAFKTGKDKTSWIKISCFQKLADLAVKYLHKGARIGVVGRLDQSKWTTEDNQQRSSIRIIASQIEFIKTDGRGFENDQRPEDASAQHDDDVPF
jgi:single-strand DNA-binding protein